MADEVTEADYERLRRATETYREDLVIRLGGEVGVRPSEIARLYLSDVEEHGDHYFLLVREGDGNREAYLPADVEHDLRKYSHAKGVGEDERPFDVTGRRLQMLVSEVGERAGLDLSSRDLHRYFARSRIREGVPLHVVCKVGGWNRLDNLNALLTDLNRETIAGAFAGGQPYNHLRRTVAVVTDVGEALADAETRQAVEEAVCKRLVDSEGYYFAVLAAGEGEFVYRANNGISPERAETLVNESVQEVVETHEVQVRTEDVPSPARAVAYIPLIHGDRSFGVIAIGLETDLSALERDVLGVLGRQIGQALAIVDHRRLLVADIVTELEFRSRDDRDVFAALSASLDCRIQLSGMVPADDSIVCFATVEGADAAEALSIADDHPVVKDVRLVENHGGGGVMEIVLSTAPSRKIVKRGGRIHEITAENGTATLIATVSGDADIRRTVDAVTGSFQNVRLAAKREIERPVETVVGFRERLDDRLTDRQKTALQAAYFGGYYEWPRSSTAEELADTLDISSPTLHNHLRKAQQKLLTAFFDGTEG